MMVPAPPNRLTPPMMTAAIDESRSASPMTAEPAPYCRVERKPATPAVQADRA